jgi:predicted O-linked N-acetylglucosamine transferase (SPINDLY family)
MPIPSSRQIRRHGSASNAAKQKIERWLRDASEARGAGRLLRALDLCEAALKLDPQHVDALCRYASLAMEGGRPEVALEAARRAAALRPNHAEAHHWMGVALHRMGRIPDAVASLGRAIELEPERVDSLLQIGNAFLDSSDAKGAEPFLNRALDIASNTAAAQTTLGRFYNATARVDDAIAAYRRAIGLDATQPEALNHLGNLLRDAGDLAGAIAAFEQAIAVAKDRPEAWSNLLLTLQCSDAHAAAAVAEKHGEFGRHFGRLFQPLPAPPRVRQPGHRLRIGYLSSNFRRHAVAKFFEPLIAAHDRDRFDVHCYYGHAVVDEVTRRIRERAEHFVTVCGMRDGNIAAQIRRDGIDILVDLDGHTAPNRLSTFFLRAAPIQVTWVGYLATTGIAAIDYRLTDPRADPPGATDGFHVETLWRLPTTAWCYRPYDEAPDPGPSPLATRGFVTFVSLNNPGKLTRTMLELWARIMGETDASRLIVHISSQASRLREIEDFFASRGIAAERLMLIGRQSVDQYLRVYTAADIALDTWPCAGGTTTCDALWMGVPVTTLAGESSFSRTGASLLASVGLSELVAQTPDAYVERAVALAHDRSRLAALRAGLRPRMRASCLTDGPAFARDIEAAFVGMLEHHAARYGAGRT